MLNFKKGDSISHFENKYKFLLIDNFDTGVYVDSNELRYNNYEEKYRFIFSKARSFFAWILIEGTTAPLIELGRLK